MSVFVGQGVGILDVVTAVVALVATWWIWDMWMKGRLRWGAEEEEEEA